MKAVKFRLSGKSAFFKKPEFNDGVYFTYNHIHKVALLGLLGAILGYDGYQNQKENEFPKFYEKLNHLKISIVPVHYENVSKKFQEFNNSVGYASTEEGGNLIVRQQWLYDIQWDIYIMLDSDESMKIKEKLFNHQSVYIPYLGTNDHLASITQVEVLELYKKDCIENLSSLCKKSDVLFDNKDIGNRDRFLYQESLPICLNKDTHFYEFCSIVYSNLKVSELKEGLFYQVKDICIEFI